MLKQMHFGYSLPELLQYSFQPLLLHLCSCWMSEGKRIDAVSIWGCSTVTAWDKSLKQGITSLNILSCCGTFCPTRRTETRTMILRERFPGIWSTFVFAVECTLNMTMCFVFTGIIMYKRNWKYKTIKCDQWWRNRRI